VGGKYSFDSENRMSWKGKPIAPEEPRFEVTDLDREVEELVNTVFSENPGKIDLSKIPTNHSQALEALDFAMLHLTNF
ncbi:MAG: cryptochrome/photolyase family protein, partial [Candidatus Thermoplasmatota archaeon]|nr:cryptochrome/photolyase family protein [Candidatus Thermoplasmatota archaeon]